MRLKVTNNADAFRYVNTVAGPKMIPPKGSLTAEFNEGERKSMETRLIGKNGPKELTIEVLEADRPAGLAPGATLSTPAGPTEEDLHKMTKADLADLIEKRHGERPPTSMTKDELIERAQEAPAGVDA